MTNNWLKTFEDSTKNLLYDIIALEVYDDIFQKIAGDDSLDNPASKREKFYTELESKYDKTTDPFTKLVIAQSFITGDYHVSTGLSRLGTLEVYKGHNGKRYNEFSNQLYDSIVNIVEYLVSNNRQFILAHQIMNIAIQRDNKRELKDRILSLVNKIKLGTNEGLTVTKIEFLVVAINYLLEDKAYRTPGLLSKIDDMLEFSVNQGDTAKSEKATYNIMGFDCIFPAVYGLKIKYYRKLNDTLQEKEVIKKFAETYETLGEKRFKKGDASNIEVAIFHYENAVALYQQYGFKSELSIAKQNLDYFKQKLFNMPNPNSIHRHRNLLNYLTDTEQDKINKLLEDFSKLTTHHRVQQLLKYLPRITKRQISQLRKQNKQNNPFLELFPVEILNEYEQTIFIADTEESKESYALFEHIQKNMILCGLMLKEIIEKNKTIDFSRFIDEVESISKRRYLFIKAFELFFNGEIYAALYILTPQVEWWFREITYNAGGQTSNLNDFPTEQAKTLTPIFESSELKEFLGEEQHWLFEQLMNKEPMNIRNKVAHGLELHDNGHCVYFILCILKLIVEKSDKKKW